MSRLGDFDFRKWKKKQQELQKLKQSFSGFEEKCMKELAAELRTKAVALTPTDAGNLRKSWTVGPVRRTGSDVRIEVSNTDPNASNVEYGYHTPNLHEWVPGKHMLAVSVEQLERELPNMLEQKLQKFIDRYWR
ncbi:HK97 gp10 family phage protein [Paenibacillus periandrae]|uniref:HK97 gp10 family phage protein n=1 Tax=Paenibacillus periandrae TaxID=1761741 RepID=UPI001F0917D6|nr:HK97 gp10 family phage protein [Paenibacillus periandrae]